MTDHVIGQCISRFCNQKTAYCLAFNPDEDKQNIFIAGCSDKKIYAVREREREIELYNCVVICSGTLLVVR